MKALSQPELGRLLTRVEQGELAPDQLRGLLPAAPAATLRVGITGSPGVGKSSLLNHLISRYRRLGEQVGVVAVDPTSPLSGGAVLGDRIRFTGSAGDDGVFIRSLASRGSLGGVSPAASLVAAALEGAGYGRILIETVGVGQTGYDIICLADTVVALFSPESGDAIQLLKAGILEVGDIYVVNKSDRPGAELLHREIVLSLDQEPSAAEVRHHGRSPSAPSAAQDMPDSDGWVPPVLLANSREGEGIDELAETIADHQAWLAALPPDHPRRARRIERELSFVLRSRIAQAMETELADPIAAAARRVLAGELSQWEAASRLLERLRID
jgi:LAO/AO transport system kinase